MMRTDSFWRELSEGDINFRDDLQFELKSEFVLNPNAPKNTLTQEFFIFIPNSLQIDDTSYPKEEFWIDQTNLIRYKTPTFTFNELLDPSNGLSPLYRVDKLKEQFAEPSTAASVIDEFKLFGNIVRSALRHRVSEIIAEMKGAVTPEKIELIDRQISNLHGDIKAVRERYWYLQNAFKQFSKDTLSKININHIDEFISIAIDFFLTGLLDTLREYDSHHFRKSDELLCALINGEKEHREKNSLVPKNIKGSEEQNESILYRIGILEKYMLESLLLETRRVSLIEKHGQFVGAFAAGIAMLVYMVLFVWKASEIVITSAPFIIFAVVFYILKDRLKEGIRTLFFRQAFRWFPDYSTDIIGKNGKVFGKLTESFQFIDEKDLPPGFRAIRNFDFHEELQSLKRHESIMRYKREITLYQPAQIKKARRRELTMIFRLNIHRFLEKASNALQPFFELEPSSNDIVVKELPKVYHLNILIKDSYFDAHLKKIDEIKKFRVVVDKAGIKRVEQL